MDIAWKDTPSLIPEGRKGVARIEHISVSEESAKLENMRNGWRRGGHVFTIEAGKYVRLIVNGGVMMSDTPMERRTSFEAIRNAHGDVLVVGLGLGMVLHPMLAKPEVRSVTVLEKYEDVIDLVSPSLSEYENLSIVNGDAFEWKPERGRRFNAIFFDIWPVVAHENLAEMTTLARRSARWLDKSDPHAWKGFWMRDWLKAVT